MRSFLGRLLLILALTVPVLAGRADAAPSDCTIFWTNMMGNGSWSDADNWSSTADGEGARGAPDSTDVVCAVTTMIDDPYIQITGAIDVTVRGVDLPAWTVVIVVSGSSLTLSDPAATATFGDLVINGADASLTSAAPVVVTGTSGLHGPLHGDLTTNGVRAGEGAAVDGDLTITDGGFTLFQVDDSYNNGNLTVGGTLTLAGELIVAATNRYVPVNGESFDLMTAADIQGSFNGRQFTYRKYGNSFIDDEYTATKVTGVVKPLPAFTIGSAPDVSESAGTATVTVERENPMDRDVKVDYATVDDTAVAGTDYTSTSGTLTFAPGETSKTITVPIIDDSVAGPGVAFTVHLSNPVIGVIADETNDRRVQVYDDDPPVIDSVEGGPVVQGATNQLLTVHGAGFTGATGVSFSRSGLKAVAGSLHVVDDATLTVRVGAASTMVTGPVSVTVTTDSGDFSCADCLSVVARPVITSGSPDVLAAGVARRTVTLTGTGFAEGAKVTVAGASVLGTEYVSPTELRVTMSVPASRAPGAASLRVANPDGAFSRCTTCMSFVAAPTLDAGALAARRGTTQTVHLSGTGFADSLTLTGPTGVSFSDLVVTPTDITATMSVAATTRTATGQKVTITNPASAGWGSVVGPVLTVCTKTAPTCGS
jgi:hypothetical protein